MARASRYIAVDIGADLLKVGAFELPVGGAPVLLGVAAASLVGAGKGDLPFEVVLASTLKRLLLERGWQKWPARVSVAGHAVLSRLVQLPPVSEDQLVRTVEHEAVQTIPFSLDEVVWDYQLMPRSEAGLEALLVAAKAGFIEGIVHALTAIGVRVEVITAAPAAVGNAIRCATGSAASTLVLDLGARGANFIFMDGERMLFRSVPVGAAAVTLQVAEELSISIEEAERIKRLHGAVCLEGMPASGERERDVVLFHLQGYVTRLTQELLRSITFYRTQQGGRAPEKIYLTGGGALLAGLDRLLSERLQLEVEQGEPLTGMEVLEDAGPLARCQLAELAGLAQLAAGAQLVDINLLPKAVRAAQLREARRPAWMFCGLLLILLISVCAAGLGVRTRLQREENGYVEQRVNMLQALEDQLRPLELQTQQGLERLDRYEALVARRLWLVKQLDALRGVLPVGMFICGVEPLDAALADDSDNKLVGLRISVVSYLDAERKGVDPVIMLRDRLRQVPSFSEKTEVFRRPTKGLFARQFVIDLFFADEVSG
jgi:type IV pilus assembly protein PilM